jgi:hypothetical protein
LDTTGFTARIINSVAAIYFGRKALTIDGEEHEGHISYDLGISGAMKVFKDAQASGDPETMLKVERTFLNEELQFCDHSDSLAFSSVTQAIRSFDDSLRALAIMQNNELYRAAEQTYPTHSRYRIHGLPKDAVHIAATAHRTRIANLIRAPGMNQTEKSLFQQRASNMAALQHSYLEKQKTTLAQS